MRLDAGAWETFSFVVQPDYLLSPRSEFRLTLRNNNLLGLIVPGTGLRDKFAQTFKYCRSGHELTPSLILDSHFDELVLVCSFSFATEYLALLNADREVVYERELLSYSLPTLGSLPDIVLHPFGSKVISVELIEAPIGDVQFNISFANEAYRLSFDQEYAYFEIPSN